ncbi:MAG: hypothetical protein AAFU85_19320 [Planctomycetota bacterium]
MNRLLAFAALVVLSVPATATAQPPSPDTSRSVPAVIGPPPPIPGNPALFEPPSVPISSGPYATGNLTTVARPGTAVDRILQRVAFEPSADQIRFDVQVLTVSPDLRDQIYAQIAGDNVHTEITQIETATAPKADDAARASVHRIASGSIVTTAVLEEPVTRHLMELVKENPASSVTARPTMIVAEGQLGAIQQQVQRPFLSKLEEVRAGDETSVRSDIHVLNEGFDFAVQAETEGETLLVRTKLQNSRVVDVKTHHVYGIGEGRKTVQVPSHEVRIAAATERLRPGQTLLLDPYMETERTVAKPAKPPVIGQFLSSSKPSVERLNTLLLITATKIQPIQPSAAKTKPGAAKPASPVIQAGGG